MGLVRVLAGVLAARSVGALAARLAGVRPSGTPGPPARVPAGVAARGPLARLAVTRVVPVMVLVREPLARVPARGPLAGVAARGLPAGVAARGLPARPPAGVLAGPRTVTGGA